MGILINISQTATDTTGIWDRLMAKDRIKMDKAFKEYTKNPLFKSNTESAKDNRHTTSGMLNSKTR